MIELISDLGGGKTTFVQGLAAELGYRDAVTSPTFTLGNVYRVSDSLQIHHYDLYRLGEGGILADEIGEDIGDPHIITIIEWAGVAEAQLPPDRLRISFEVTADTERHLSFSAGGPVSQAIIKELSA